MGALNEEQFLKFASENKLEVKDYKINNLKQNEIFLKVLSRIFLLKMVK